MIHIIKYQKKEVIANETAAFYFTKPSDFVFKAGQFGDFTIINPVETDSRGNTRTFSISSAPSEGYISISTRLRDSAFKRNLQNLKPGDELILDAPMGIFTLRKNDTRPVVFIAGGIGIAPFKSIIADATENKFANKIYLFYSNKNKESAPYLHELFSFAQQNSNFTFIPTMTQMENPISTPDWKGERGRISLEMLDKYLPKNSDPIFYLAGPQAMVKTAEALLGEYGAKKENIKIEEFAGY